MGLLLLLLGVADVSVALEAEPGCGGPTWRALGAAVEAYCRDEAAASEALGCRVARYTFDHCDAAPALHHDDDQRRGAIRDPRDRSYAWLLTFARGRHGWVLERFVYEYDDCDALGVPAPPRGRLRMSELRRDPDDRD